MSALAHTTAARPVPATRTGAIRRLAHGIARHRAFSLGVAIVLFLAAVQFKLATIWQAKGHVERAVAGYEVAIRLRPDYLAALRSRPALVNRSPAQPWRRTLTPLRTLLQP